MASSSCGRCCACVSQSANAHRLRIGNLVGVLFRLVQIRPKLVIASLEFLLLL